MELGTRYLEQLDPNNPGDWKLVYETPQLRYWECDIGEAVVGRTEWLNTEQILADNAERLKVSEGARWGDGQIAASIPLNEYYKGGFAEATKDRDMKWKRKYLNEHPEYKTFKGDI